MSIDVHANRSRNASGKNQHGDKPIEEQWPDLAGWVQELLNNGTRQKDIPGDLLATKGATVSLRSIQRLVEKGKVKTARRNGLSDGEKTVAILQIMRGDPLKRWGYRTVKEKLAGNGVHLPQCRANDEAAAIARHPNTRRVHKGPGGLFSSGPGEEVCADGHEKLQAMGISCYGFIDKFSRYEMALWAVPNARVSAVPLALYLWMIKEMKAIPIQMTTDKGSETGQLAAMQTVLRQRYQPFLDAERFPPHVFVKSIYNITRERSWRPLYDNELAAVHHEWESGKVASGFCPGNTIHEGISLWLWSRVVQDRLDNYRNEKNNHRIRFQKKMRLPSGGRPYDFFHNPHKWGGKDQFIRIPDDDMWFIDKLIEEYSTNEKSVLQFGTDDIIDLADTLYKAIGQPHLDAKNCWPIFSRMINARNSREFVN